MATRTIKFLGKAYSESGDVSLEVNINGNQVHNSTVTTKTPTGTENTDDLYEMFTFDIDSSVSGNIPVSIAVSGGTAYFRLLNGNYSGFEATRREDGTLVFPLEVTVAPGDFYRDLNNNTAESDGKSNVSIEPLNGATVTREPLDNTYYGDWHYRIPDGSTFTCDYYIDPSLEILEVPTE